MELLQDPARIDAADPFAPIMLANAAGFVVKQIGEVNSERLAVFLRPCELESLHALASDDIVDISGLLLISSDCLAVFPQEYFEERRRQTSDHDEITLEMLRFAAQGGILPSRYRLGCQLCKHPFPVEVDVSIELVGIPTQQSIVIGTSDRIDPDALQDPLELVEVPRSMDMRRHETLQRLENWRGKSLWTTVAALTPDTKGVQHLMEHLQACSACRLRIEELCPQFNVDLTMSPEERDLVAEHWLVSCGGCGMCEHHCPTNYPLFQVIAALRYELAEGPVQ
jgi:formate dehydrogenase subunit beta